MKLVLSKHAYVFAPFEVYAKRYSVIVSIFFIFVWKAAPLQLFLQFKNDSQYFLSWFDTLI